MKIYIILLNYNGWADTIECLESVLKNDYPNYQVIVLDNNSPNNSMEYIKAWAEGRLDVWVNQDHPLRKLSYPPVSKPIPYVYYTHEKVSKGGIEKSFWGRKSRRIDFNKFWLSYYGQRNLIWLGKKYATNKPLFYIQLAINIIKIILGIIVYNDDNKYKRIKFVLNAYLDGLNDKFDNNKPKRILYGE